MSNLLSFLNYFCQSCWGLIVQENNNCSTTVGSYSTMTSSCNCLIKMFFMHVLLLCFWISVLKMSYVGTYVKGVSNVPIQVPMCCILGFSKCFNIDCTYLQQRIPNQIKALTKGRYALHCFRNKICTYCMLLTPKFFMGVTYYCHCWVIKLISLPLISLDNLTVSESESGFPCWSSCCGLRRTSHMNSTTGWHL